MDLLKINFYKVFLPPPPWVVNLSTFLLSEKIDTLDALDDVITTIFITILTTNLDNNLDNNLDSNLDNNLDNQP